MKNYFYLLLTVSVLFNLDLPARTMHVIMAADTIHEISSITKPDVSQMRVEFQTIARHTRLVLKEKVFMSSEFGKDNITSYLKALRIEPNDVVIFYFSGHGYHTHHKTSQWPWLSFELYKSGLDLKWIADIIRKKNPRFSLVMADCCNNFAEQGYMAETKNICIKLTMSSPVYQGYHHLFLNAKGHITICSSAIGQFSYGSQRGGLYTQCFLASLNQEISQETPSWAALLRRVCSYMGHIQKPLYEFQ